MAAYVVRRVLWMLPVLFFISLITFGLMHTVEGGPWDSERQLPANVIQNLNHKYGLDKPLWRQYVDLATNALRGDLGVSFQRQNKPVTQVLLGAFKITAALGLMALATAALIGVSLGIAAAVHRNGALDYLSVLLASLGSAIPSFVLGIFLMYFLSVKLHFLPTFGWDLKAGLIPGLLPRWRQAIMPVLTLAALPT